MKLKPCPFCAGDALCHTRQDEINPNMTLYYVMCLDCTGKTDAFSNDQNAAKAWNQRPGEPVEPEREKTKWLYLQTPHGTRYGRVKIDASFQVLEIEQWVMDINYEFDMEKE